MLDDLIDGIRLAAIFFRRFQEGGAILVFSERMTLLAVVLLDQVLGGLDIQGQRGGRGGGCENGDAGGGKDTTRLFHELHSVMG